LSSRPSRPPDYEAENRALLAIAQHMADSPRTTLQELAEVALEVCRAGSAGVSLISEKTGDFYWPAIAGAWKPHIGGGTPRHFGPCGVVLDRNAAQLFTHPERYYPYLLPVLPRIAEALLTPFYVEGQAVGTVWVVAHDAARKFDAEDIRLIESLARFAAAAYPLRAAVFETDLQSKSLVDVNQALMVSSVRQHELTGQAQEAETALRGSEERMSEELAATQQLQQTSTQLIREDNVEALYEQILDAAVAIMRSGYASLQMLYPERAPGGELGLLCYRGFNPQAVRFWTWVQPDAKSTCGIALRTGQRVIVPDVQASGFMAGSEDQAIYLQTGIRAVQSTPLVSRTGKVLGMISTHWNQPYQPSECDLRLLDVLARQAADLIERSQADKALQNLNADLKHFSYAASHDMQEPLRTVLNCTQLLARLYKGRLDSQADQLIAYTVDGAKRLEALLSDLRQYWSVNEQRLENLVPINCNAVLEEALTYLDASMKESGALVTHDGLPTIIGEELPLTLLMQNLIGNAIKYRRPEAPSRIHISAERTSSMWRFSVTDNGIGIEAKFLESIFAPFKRLHGRDYPGTGLGLAMCRKIVERYRGRIWVESIFGEGSTFYFTLPQQGADKHEILER
jgi:signal transduction histidine kinase